MLKLDVKQNIQNGMIICMNLTFKWRKNIVIIRQTLHVNSVVICKYITFKGAVRFGTFKSIDFKKK